MHTLLLSKVISQQLYFTILSNHPHEMIEDESDFVKYEINNNLLPLLTEDEKESAPLMYLCSFKVKTKKKDGGDKEKKGTKEEGGKEEGDSKIYYMFEILINIQRSLFGRGYKSTPVGSIPSFIFSNIFVLVEKAIPELSDEDYRTVPDLWIHPLRIMYNELDKVVQQLDREDLKAELIEWFISRKEMSDELKGALQQLDSKDLKRMYYKRDWLLEKEIYLWPELKKMYEKLYPGQVPPGRADILRALARTEDKEVARVMERLFPTLDVFRAAECDETVMAYFNECYWPDYKLRRIDYSLDIYTEYKGLLLKLVSMGYGITNKKTTVYHGKGRREVESYYIELASYHINIYDKFTEMVKKDPQSEIEKKEKYLLRFEIQILKDFLNNQVSNNNKLGNDSIKRELQYFNRSDSEYCIMQKYLHKIIGGGNYYTYDVALEIVNASEKTKNKKEKLCKVLYLVAKHGGIRNFLECVKKHEITDKDYDFNEETAKGHLKELHKLNVNPVTISQAMQKQMEAIEQKIHMELLPDSLKYPQSRKKDDSLYMLQYPQYRYGIDFLYNPLVYLEINNEVWKKSREMGEPPINSYISSVHMGKGN